MKKLISLLLALPLCLSLAVPAMAAGADGLTAAEAKAYLNELNKINETIQYAGLLDMDQNGKPELVVVTLTDGESDYYSTANVLIWTVKNDAAVETAKESFEVSTDGAIRTATAPNGQIYIHARKDAMRPGIHRIYHTIMSMTGVVDMLIQDYGENGDEENYFQNGITDAHAITKTEYSRLSESYGIQSLYDMAFGFGMSWYYDKNIADSVQETCAQLKDTVGSPAAPAPGTYGEYTITLDYATVTFESAKVETKQIRFTYQDMEGLEEDGGTKAVTVVTVKPGSYIKVVGDPNNGSVWDGDREVDWVTGEPGSIIGENHFLMMAIGAPEPMLIDGPAEKSFRFPNNVYLIGGDH